MKIQMRKLVGLILALIVVFTAAVPDSAIYAAVNKVHMEEPIVIVLDPGHGGTDGGAVRRWGGKTYREKDLNLAIARACKTKLEEYAGVEVYLTRTSDRYVSLSGRVAYAKQKNADLFVALHNNSSFKSSDSGACVFYPNRGYKAKIGAEGRDAAQCIQRRLVSLGLKNKGISIRNSENNTRYPDKSKADYYCVIKESKLAGFPGLIVEHAFVSNAGDCKKYLSTEAKLKKLGVADAEGIAEYFGLVKAGAPKLKKAESNQDGTVTLYWNRVNKVDGYRVYRRIVGEKSYSCIAEVKGAGTVNYTDTAIKPAVTYEYAVCGWHKSSRAVTYTFLSNSETAVFPLPIPTEVTVKETEDGRIDISWKAVDGADGYILERRSGTETEFSQIAVLEASEQPCFQDVSADSDESYEYRVCGFVKSGKKTLTGEYSQIAATK